MSKQIVLRLQLNCEKCKRRAMKTLAGVSGVDSINVDVVESKIIVIGDADPVCLTSSLRKFGYAELLSVGPLPIEEPEPEVKPEAEQEAEQERIYVILPRTCGRCTTYYWSDENANACSIL